MDDDFAAYAWSNDQRIAGLTGQNFTERYRTLVLADRKQLFDSGPATLALTAVYLTAPTRELETLKAIQHVRFVEGKDITKQHTLISVLKALGLDAAASLVENSDTELLKASSIRTKRAQAVMREFNARGVPTFIASSGQMRWILDTNEMYSNPNALISQLKAA